MKISTDIAQVCGTLSPLATPSAPKRAVHARRDADPEAVPDDAADFVGGVVLPSVRHRHTLRGRGHGTTTAGTGEWRRILLALDPRNSRDTRLAEDEPTTSTSSRSTSLSTAWAHYRAAATTSIVSGANRGAELLEGRLDLLGLAHPAVQDLVLGAGRHLGRVHRPAAHREGGDAQPGTDLPADLGGPGEGTPRHLVAPEGAGRSDHPAVLAGPVAAGGDGHRHRRRVQQPIRGRAETTRP